MLAALETHFLTALQTAISESSVALAAGPFVGPLSSSNALIELSASRMKPAMPLSDELAEARSPAHLTKMHQFTANGTTKDFTLPQSAKGDVVEVESPP